MNSPEEPERELTELAAAYGVATEYWDWRGQHVRVSKATILAVLRAFDVEVSSAADATAALRAKEDDRWRRRLPEFVAARVGVETHVIAHVPHGAEVRVWVELEDGGRSGDLEQRHHVVEPRHVDGALFGEAMFAVPGDLPVGYHQLCAVTGADDAVRVPLLVAPASLPLPLPDDPAEPGAGRGWGFTLQLYSVRSRRSQGLGDLADLAELATWSAGLGADFALVNPLHAGDPVPPVEPSPYLPTTRRFTNPLYVRIEDIPEYVYADAAVRARIDEIGQPLREANDSAELLDRDAAWLAKLAALDLLRVVPRQPGREAEYHAYLEREGSALVDFATWCVIAEQHGTKWQEWPAELVHPRSPEVARFRAEHANRIELYRYSQWLCEEQLAAAQRRARSAGMRLGIVHDLPVGVHPDGADAWALQDVLASRINVGAPPDAFNQQGQDWSQPPWRPDRLAATGYAAWRDLARGVLRHGGGLRVDHVPGLFRLWWVPEDSEPTAGTYIRYDHEAMLGILAVEAWRAGAVLIGEDLGTVEPWVRDVLTERGVFGTSVAWFEYDDDGSLKPPERWRELCLATVTVHDLPPTAAYFEGAHIDLRERLGLLTRPVEEERADFEAERQRWIDVLTERGFLAAGADLSRRVVEAMHRYVASSPARLVGVSLTDAVDDRRTQNQPGTHREYANWQQPLTDATGRAVLLEELPGRADLHHLVATLGVGDHDPATTHRQSDRAAG